jgi:hypothetical protein
LAKRVPTTDVECVELMINKMNESAKSFQKLVDALGEVDSKIFFTKEEINSVPEHDKKMSEWFDKKVVEPLREWLKENCEHG